MVEPVGHWHSGHAYVLVYQQHRLGIYRVGADVLGHDRFDFALNTGRNRCLSACCEWYTGTYMPAAWKWGAVYVVKLLRRWHRPHRHSSGPHWRQLPQQLRRPTQPTQPTRRPQQRRPGDVVRAIATTRFVAASFAPIDSPTFTGTPTAPTQTPGDNTTKIATTAYVLANRC